MRPSAELRPPGVYPSPGTLTTDNLQIADTHIAGFVGLTLKGPLDEPQRIANWDEFVASYGYDSQFYTCDSVEAFFRNGGDACYVVRIAHLPRDGAKLDDTHAASAERVIQDDWNKPTIRIRALNEGEWGNKIWVEFKHATGARCLLTWRSRSSVRETRWP